MMKNTSLLLSCAAFLIFSTLGFSASAVENRELGESVVDSKEGFAKDTKILTLDGYRLITKLNPGDLVLSWDARNQMTVPNQILSVRKHENQNLFFFQPAYLMMKTTLGQKFFMPANGSFRSLDQIENYESLQGVRRHSTGLCETFLTGPRGSPRTAPDILDAYEIRLLAAPFNFIAEGVVVGSQR